MYNINTQNLQQSSEIMYINNEINLLQEKKRKNLESISKWVSTNWKNKSKKGTKNNFLSNQKNTKYSEEYISKQD